jgi:hypothetical protein
MKCSLLLATSKFDPKFLTLRMDHGDAFIFSKDALGMVLYFVPLPRNLSIINSPKVPYFSNQQHIHSPNHFQKPTLRFRGL